MDYEQNNNCISWGIGTRNEKYCWILRRKRSRVCGTDTGFENRVIEILTKYKDDNCVVFTDLYGGSVNQCFFKNLNDFNFHLVTGMNLAVILECVLASVEIDEEFIRNAIEMSKSQFCYMNDLVNIASDDDDD